MTSLKIALAQKRKSYPPNTSHFLTTVHRAQSTFTDFLKMNFLEETQKKTANKCSLSKRYGKDEEELFSLN